MKAIKKPKHPNPNGRPLPSKFNRTMYQSFVVLKDMLGNRTVLRSSVGGIVEDHYGKRYQVQADGSIRNVV